MPSKVGLTSRSKQPKLWVSASVGTHNNGRTMRKVISMIRRATQNGYSPQDKLLAALNAAKTIKEIRQLGHLLLLPTEIKSKVLIRSQGNLISIVCVLNPKDRLIHINADNVEENLLPISTPNLVFQCDIPFSKTHNLVSRGTGYLYEYHRADTLTEALKTVKHFFFPHVYHKAYMCISCGKNLSPRALSLSFWASNFTNDWHSLFYGGSHWGSDVLGADAKLVAAPSPDKYQEHQTSTSPSLDKKNRDFLQGYTDHFELEEKPLGVFISNDKEVVKAAKKENCISSDIVTGFVFLRNQDYWVWLKNGQFLHLKPEQVKIL